MWSPGPRLFINNFGHICGRRVRRISPGPMNKSGSDEYVPKMSLYFSMATVRSNLLSHSVRCCDKQESAYNPAILVTGGFWIALCVAFYSPSDHYCDVIMGAIASQITSLTIVYSAVYSDADQRKYQSSASLASNAENVSIWWRHHDDTSCEVSTPRDRVLICRNSWWITAIGPFKLNSWTFTRLPRSHLRIDRHLNGKLSRE